MAVIVAEFLLAQRREGRAAQSLSSWAPRRVNQLIHTIFLGYDRLYA